MNYKMYELGGANSCRKSRAFTTPLLEQAQSYVLRAGAVKGLLRDVMTGRFSGTYKMPDGSSVPGFDGTMKDGLYEELKTAFDQIPYPSERQRSLQVYDAYRQIKRYADSEKRKSIGPIIMMALELSPEVTVECKPDFIYADPVNGVEVVMMKASKPNLSGKKAKEDLGLYTLLKYGESLVASTGIGRPVTVKASYYFLRHNDDSNSLAAPHFNPDFFDPDGKNIVSLREQYDPAETESDLDRKFKPIVDSFADGIDETECDKDDCQKCDLFDICKYEEPPIRLPEKAKKVNLDDLELTESQSRAIEYEKGVVRINAGAGAGKTMVVALRVATLISKGVKPEEILMITFTNTGAEEMRVRIRGYLEAMGIDVDPARIAIFTFNGFGNEVIKKEYARFGFTEAPQIIDDVERSAIISDILNDVSSDPKTYPLSGLDFRNYTSNGRYAAGALTVAKKVFDIMKANSYTPSDIKEIMEADPAVGNTPESAVTTLAALYDRYDETLRSRNLIEFSDQEALVFELLDQDPFYFESYGFRHIIVDEFQDTSENQIKLLKVLISAPSFASLMVVGDDSQSIFGFRNTSPEFIIHFDKYIGRPVDDIDLLENFRSTPEIIDFANRINNHIVSRVFKNLVATRPHGAPVTVKGFHSPQAERNYVVEGIEAKIQSGVKPEDIAIICYSKYELMQMGTLLREKSIPAVMLNPEPLLENSRVRAAIAFCKAMDSPDVAKESKAILTYENALMGGGILDLSEDEIAGKISDGVSRITDIQMIDTEADRLDALMEALKAIDLNEDEVYEGLLNTLSFKHTVRAVLDYMGQFTVFGANTAVRRTHNYPGVVLTTAHSSKGLEWPVVFDMISKYDDEAVERSRRVETSDERYRLLFVSATRAKKELFVTGQYIAFGKKGEYTYNKFLRDSFQAAGKEYDLTAIKAEKAVLDAEAKARRKEEREAKKKAELAVKKSAGEAKKEKEKAAVAVDPDDDFLPFN